MSEVSHHYRYAFIESGKVFFADELRPPSPTTFTPGSGGM